MGIVAFSDSSGQFEAVLFSEMLNQDGRPPTTRCTPLSPTTRPSCEG